MWLVSFTVLATACEKDDFITREEQLAIDRDLIATYLTENNIEAEELPSGVHYAIEEEGTGLTPEANQLVTIRYEQYLLDGTVINSTGPDSSVTFNISSALPGVQQSLLLLKEGGKGIFLIPSNLAFGTSSSDLIPPNSIFRFDLELVEVVTQEEQQERQQAADIAIITDYIANNEIENVDSTESGIYYFFEEEGEGDRPTASSAVTVRYTGYLLNGQVFDQTPGETTRTFPLSGVIPGWTEALQLFQRGSKGTILLPSAMAYGSTGTNGIPPNTVLAFDIELVDFE
jgi:FKBP-type peptidyl-prolyl cis-trans isomerase